ncbi:aldehyde dehydrogenase family protein [Geobacter sp. DSM 9736]|uniref:aldehyde dehydrogenase family protein n=1 Tax=Geobacter sp. DSM 9736 TaxID=1277350 RepID=UPI000B505307|nr:aldehyde dehydrogenase family protein [Geobacter sp. DSM 9736]SNB44879.1 Acyl-CoA reductase [Geobacter sp. DSM 9736]
MAKRYKVLVGGEWIGDDGRGIDVINPFDDSVVGVVPETTMDGVDEAIEAARAGFIAVSQLPGYRRAEILNRTAELILRDQEEIAEIIAREAGKSWKFAITEAKRSAETFSFAAVEAKAAHGEIVPMDASPVSAGRFGFYIRTPIGVIGAISPFNFPLNLVAHKVAPAIAAGNSIVLKPATKTPLSSIKLAELLTEAGLPPGGINLVIGSGKTVGNKLVEDERLAMLTFTGSPPVGRDIKSRSGLKRVTLELGSNSPTIIAEDGDVDHAVGRCVVGSFANSGQVCISVQRIFVHTARYDEFIGKFIEATNKLKVGNPLDPDSDIGPMISRYELERAVSWLEEAKNAGATIAAGGGVVGNCLQPTILTGVTRDMKVMCSEVFAPIVSVVRCDSYEEALDMADDSVYGLQAGVYTSDINKAFHAIKKLDVGGVIINDVPTFRVDHMPYGGNKESGLGREGVRYAMEEMTNIKMVCINL